MSIASKKQELINFIMWKLRYQSTDERESLRKQLKKLSWANLQAYAIRNDFIDKGERG